MGVTQLLDRERTVAPPGYNRWLIPPAALAIHLSIGQVYAFSVFKNPLVERFGSSETAVAVVFSLAIAVLGLSAAFLGPWMERNGPRKAMVLSAVCFSGGFLVSALGVAAGQLWVVYLGYGLLGGIGLGIGYISPVSTLIKWFPDRPGLSTGLAIMGFGGGAFIASAVSDRLLRTLAPEPTAAIAPAFVVLGLAYLLLMTYGAWLVKVPPPGYAPGGYDPAEDETGVEARDITADQAIRTHQFWLVWVVLFTNVTAGIGILEQASPMIQDFFDQVDASAAAGYVGLLSIANMLGRFVWSSSSDYVGRRPVYAMYLGVGAVAVLTVILIGASSLAVFVLGTGLLISFYGGGFATVPAYLKDLFGSHQVGAIHGRLLTAWSAAGVAGPLIINILTESQRRGGAEGAAAYRPSLFVVVAMLAIGFVANLFVRPLVEGASDEDIGRRHRAEPAGSPG